MQGKGFLSEGGGGAYLGQAEGDGWGSKKVVWGVAGCSMLVQKRDKHKCCVMWLALQCGD